MQKSSLLGLMVLCCFGCMDAERRPGSFPLENQVNFYEDNPTYSANPSHLEDWVTDSPQSVGMNPSLLAEGSKHLRALSYPASFLVIHKQKLVWEDYFRGGKMTDSKNIHSASKSIMSALFGIALEQGHIKDVHQPIKDYLGHRFRFRGSSKRITIDHLLKLGSGKQWTEDDTEYDIEEEDSWIQAILNLNSLAEPGTRYNYSTGDTHLLSATLTEAVKMSACEYAQRHLFDKLNIEPTHWGRDVQGYCSGGCNVYLSPREVAKFGLLYLNNGVWNGEQLISPDWIKQSWTHHQQVDANREYGYLWWMIMLDGTRAYKMWGWGGQYVYVIPSQDLVVVMTTETTFEHEELDGDIVLRNFVLPALR